MGSHETFATEETAKASIRFDGLRGGTLGPLAYLDTARFLLWPRLCYRQAQPCSIAHANAPAAKPLRPPPGSYHRLRDGLRPPWSLRACGLSNHRFDNL